MADIDRMRNFLRDHITDRTHFDHSNFDDESAVEFAPTLKYVHGKNIPLTALVCAWRAVLLGEKVRDRTPKQIRDGVLMYLLDSGICNGEEFGRWYSYFHLDAVLWIRDLARKYADAEVLAACDDWLLSFAGWLALGMGPRQNGNRAGAYDDRWGPLVMDCNLAPAIKSQACVHFGKRSSKRYDVKHDGNLKWIHTAEGFLSDSIILTLRSIPSEARATVLSAAKGDPTAILQCWEWAKKRIPKHDHYIFARWTGGLAFWSPILTAAQTPPGTLAVLRYEPSKDFDTLQLVHGFKGQTWQHEERYSGQRPTVFCEFDGYKWVVRGNWPEAAWPIELPRPAGTLVSWHEIKDGAVVRAEVTGLIEPPSVPTEPTDPTKPTDPTPPPSGKADAFDWLVNAPENLACVGEGFYSTISPIAGFPHLFAVRLSPGEVPWGSGLLWRDELGGEIRLIAECGYKTETGEIGNIRTFWGPDGKLGVRWLPRWIDRAEPMRYQTRGLLVEHALLDGFGPYRPDKTRLPAGQYQEDKVVADTTLEHVGVTEQLGEPAAILRRTDEMGVEPKNVEKYEHAFGRGAFGFATWKSWKARVFDRECIATKVVDAGPPARIYGIDPLDPELRERWFVTPGFTGPVDGATTPTRRPSGKVSPDDRSRKKRSGGVGCLALVLAVGAALWIA